MTKPRFSIVIPTRDRADTLHYALLTCLAQQFDNYEIIVCDNCSSPATKQVVDALKSDKIKYVRSDKPLAMSANWELALSHAKGEYVIVIGDDDGLLFHALRDIDHLTKLLDVKAFRWECVTYYWPNIPRAEFANRLRIPLVCQSSVLLAKKVIPKVISFEMEYTTLPMLYNSAIHEELIEKLRQKIGRVFGAASPDVYSGFAFAYLAQSYASIGRPMAISGISSKSNGCTFRFLKGKSPVAEEFRHLNSTQGFTCHPRAPDVPTIPATVADAFQHVKDALFPHDSSLRIDRKKLANACLQRLQADSPEEWSRHINAIREVLSDDAKIVEWFDSKYLNQYPHISRDNPPRKKGYDGKDLYLDAAEFGVTDVFGAAKLCEKLMGYMERAIEWPKHQGVWRRLRSAARILIRGQ